jgi:SAM-dependent methyltransferase
MADPKQTELKNKQNYSELVTHIGALMAERDELIAKRDELAAQGDYLAAKHDEVVGSRSWALTAPLRSLAWKARHYLRGAPAVAPAPGTPAPPPAPRSDLPSPELRARVTGTEDEAWFRASGAMAISDISSALASVDHSIGDFERIYDFGCGCGRISLPLCAIVPASRLTATDADVEATDWLRDRLPEASVAANGDLPPLPYGDASFDLIVGWSVMTHLPEDFQDAWLAELARVLAPGGTMLLTIHGPTHFDKVDAPADDPSRVALQEKGIVYFENYGPESPFAPYYQTTYHHLDYIREHWSQYVDIVDIIVGGGRPTHDMVVTTKKD